MRPDRPASTRWKPSDPSRPSPPLPPCRTVPGDRTDVPFRTPRSARSASGLAVLLAGVMLGGCGETGTPEPADDRAPLEAESPEAATDGLQLSLGIDHVTYAPGATIQVVIRVVNRLDEPRTLVFPDGQRVDAVLLDDDGEVVSRWSDGQMFTQALGEERFEPGDEGRQWELVLTAPETPGSYRIRGLLTSMEGNLETTLPVEVATSPGG
ncbi:MAG: hypothetical protein EA350_08910 [Gemmatimonadales bacterium]|nr:MAG: hypothetical protein EA350_08910 [Gemmatimonadales bacterium]